MFNVGNFNIFEYIFYQFLLNRFIFFQHIFYKGVRQQYLHPIRSAPVQVITLHSPAVTQLALRTIFIDYTKPSETVLGMIFCYVKFELKAKLIPKNT